MKEHAIISITIVGLSLVVLLQGIWLRHTYVLVKENIIEKAESRFVSSVSKEVLSRAGSGILPSGTEVTGLTISGEGEIAPEDLALQETLLKFGSRVSLSKLDSIYKNSLKEVHIDTDIIINKVQTSNNSILESSNIQKMPGWKSIKTSLIPIRMDKSEGVQAILLNPYWDIFQQMGILLIATAIIMFLIGYCIIYQIRIIIHQDKLAKLKEDFSYAMIHDMKTPLSTIILGIHGLQNKKIDSLPELKEMYLKHAQEECDHLLKLTEKILTLSKLESKSVKMNKELIALQPLIESLTEKYALVKEKTIHFNIDLSTPYIYADREHLKEVVNNLIDNSIKYSKDSVQIDITSTEKNGDVLLKVKDNGLGIAIKDQAKIFERFERAAAVKRNRKGGASGFGFGLNYVQQVVKAHGGRVELDSIEGMYSEFILYFPHSLQEEETA